MKLEISTIRRASFKEWDDIWLRCRYATYFHSREWAEIWNLYTQGDFQPAPKWIEFSDGNAVVLPLTFYRKNRGLTKCYVSSPAGTYGGWLATDALQESHACLLAELISRRLRNLTWRVNPYDELAVTACTSMGVEDETETLDLNEGFDAVLRRSSRGHRSAINKAIKRGVSVKLARHRQEWEEYFQLYQSSLRRWGDRASSVYGWDLFRHLYERHSHWTKLWLALYLDKVIGGALCFYSPRHAVYWHGAALDEFFHLRPINLLLCDVIKDACDKGCDYFDFNPSGGHEGVKVFKQRFGSRATPCPVISTETQMSRFLDRWGRRLLG